jgi:hypothetical protein
VPESGAQEVTVNSGRSPIRLFSRKSPTVGEPLGVLTTFQGANHTLIQVRQVVDPLPVKARHIYELSAEADKRAEVCLREENHCHRCHAVENHSNMPLCARQEATDRMQTIGKGKAPLSLTSSLRTNILFYFY